MVIVDTYDMLSIVEREPMERKGMQLPLSRQRGGCIPLLKHVRENHDGLKMVAKS